MGKRKSAKPMQGPKKRAALPTSFQCLFCNHEDSVTVKIDKKDMTSELNCRICGQHFATTVNEISAAVDVYADWVDACDTVAQENGGHNTTTASALGSYRGAHTTTTGGEGVGNREEQYEEDFVVNDEAGTEDDYAAGD